MSRCDHLNMGHWMNFSFIHQPKFIAKVMYFGLNSKQKALSYNILT